MSGAADEGRAALAGLCATLVGIGLARFAYAPLLPALVEAGWFASGAAAYIGAANLIGYLAGALSAAALVRRLPAVPLLRGMMLLAALTFLACAWNLGFAWFLLWRFLSGLSGGVLMVAAPPVILAVVPMARRGRAAGVVFTGVGIGIVAAATAMPTLLCLGVPTTWLALAAASTLLTALAWRGWPMAGPQPASARPRRTTGLSWPILAVTLLYGLDALGLVPHMVFFVDFVARGLGHGIGTGAAIWIVYGVGAIVGPLAAGRVGDRIGFARALLLGLVLQMAAILIPLLAPSLFPLAVSAFVMGAFTPGMPSLVLGRLQELTGGHGQHGPWGLATTAFALAQAGGAYGMSWLYAGGAGYETLFLSGTVAMGAALMLALLTAHRT